MRRTHARNALILGLGIFLFAILRFAVQFGPGGMFNWTSLKGGLKGALSWEFPFALSSGLNAGGCYWLLIGLFQGVSSDLFQEHQRTTPNQGIRRSLRNGLLLGIAGASICFLIAGSAVMLSSWFMYNQEIIHNSQQSGMRQEPSYWLLLTNLVSTFQTFLFSGGVLVFLLSGGLAWWRHWVLQFLLWRSGSISWQYVRLLEEATQRILLRRVGGGYRFVHDLFRDYLASLEIMPSVSSPPQRSSGQQEEEIRKK